VITTEILIKNLKGSSTLSFKLDIPCIKGLWIDGSANYDTGHDFYKRFYVPAYVYYKDSSTETYTKTMIGTSTASLSEY